MFPFKGRIICGECGAIYVRSTRKGKQVCWRCQTRITKGKYCTGRAVEEPFIRKAVVKAVNMLPKHKAELESKLYDQSGERHKEYQQIQKRLNKIDAQIAVNENIISEYAKTGSLPNSLGNAEEVVENLKVEIGKLKEERDSLLVGKAKIAAKMFQIKAAIQLANSINGYADDMKTADNPACYDLEDFLQRTRSWLPTEPLDDLDNDFIIRYIDQVVIREKGFTVRFKAGIEIDV